MTLVRIEAVDFDWSDSRLTLNEKITLKRKVERSYVSLDDDDIEPDALERKVRDLVQSITGMIPVNVYMFEIEDPVFVL